MSKFDDPQQENYCCDGGSPTQVLLRYARKCLLLMSVSVVSQTTFQV